MVSFPMSGTVHCYSVSPWINYYQGQYSLGAARPTWHATSRVVGTVKRRIFILELTRHDILMGVRMMGPNELFREIRSSDRVENGKSNPRVDLGDGEMDVDRTSRR